MNRAIENFYAKTYKIILSDIKKKGVRVIHKKMLVNKINDQEDCGYYNPNNNIIFINIRYKNTYDGCFYLLHEYKHYLQRKYHEHKVFFGFQEKVEVFSDEKMNIIKSVETEADDYAVKILKTYGIDYIKPEVDWNFYKKYYFGV